MTARVIEQSFFKTGALEGFSVKEVIGCRINHRIYYAKCGKAQKHSHRVLQNQSKWGRLTTLHVSSEAEKREPQPQKKRGRLTTLHVSSEAEKREPQPQKKRGDK